MQAIDELLIPLGTLLQILSVQKYENTYVPVLIDDIILRYNNIFNTMTNIQPDKPVPVKEQFVEIEEKQPINDNVVSFPKKD